MNELIVRERKTAPGLRFQENLMRANVRVPNVIRAALTPESDQNRTAKTELYTVTLAQQAMAQPAAEIEVGGTLRASTEAPSLFLESVLPYPQNERFLQRIGVNREAITHIENIGDGAEGVCYRVVYQEKDRTKTVVIKKFTLTSSLQQEYEALKKLQAIPQVVKLLVDYVAGDNFLVLEYLDGKSIGEMLDSFDFRNPKKDGEAQRLVRINISIQVLQILQFAYQHDVEETDIKLDNLKLCGGAEVRAFDFGVLLSKTDKYRRAEQKNDFVLSLVVMIAKILDIQLPDKFVIDESNPRSLSDQLTTNESVLIESGLSKDLVELLLRYVRVTSRIYNPGTLKEGIDSDPLSLINALLSAIGSDDKQTAYIQKGNERRRKAIITSPASEDTSIDERRIRMQTITQQMVALSQFVQKSPELDNLLKVHPSQIQLNSLNAQKVAIVSLYIKSIFRTITGVSPTANAKINEQILAAADYDNDSDRDATEYAEAIANIHGFDEVSQDLTEKTDIQKVAIALRRTYMVSSELCHETSIGRAGRWQKHNFE